MPHGIKITYLKTFYYENDAKVYIFYVIKHTYAANDLSHFIYLTIQGNNISYAQNKRDSRLQQAISLILNILQSSYPIPIIEC